MSRVRELHRRAFWRDQKWRYKLWAVLAREPYGAFLVGDDRSICTSCGTGWPCATIAALDADEAELV